MPDREVLENAERAGFDVFLTADRSISYQQNVQATRIALVVLTTNNWPVIREHASAVFEAAFKAEGSVVEIVALPHPVGSRRR